MFQVNLWGSHPDDDNDDCWTGLDFPTESEARSCAADWRKRFSNYGDADVAYVEITEVIDGAHNGGELIKNPEHKRAKRAYDGEWKREAAMQAGMAFGCDGYNDEMGW